MNKIFLIILLCITFSVPADARHRRQVAEPVTHSWSQVIKLPVSKSTGLVTDTLVPQGFSSTPGCGLVLYSANDTGYITGTNGFGDKEMIMQYSLSDYGYILPASVSAVYVLFGAKYVGGNANMAAKIYAANGLGKPGSMLGTGTLKAVSAADTNGNLTRFTFPAPVNIITDKFFVSIDISALYAAGDTVGIISTRDSCTLTNPESAWEKYADNTFHALSEPGNWGIQIDMAIFPEVSAYTTSVTNIARNPFKAVCYPQPATGILQLSFTGVTGGNTSVVLKDMTGKMLRSQNMITAKGAGYITSLDVSSLSTGIYFCELCAGNNKSILKVTIR